MKPRGTLVSGVASCVALCSLVGCVAESKEGLTNEQAKEQCLVGVLETDLVAPVLTGWDYPTANPTTTSFEPGVTCAFEDGGVFINIFVDDDSGRVTVYLPADIGP